MKKNLIPLKKFIEEECDNNEAEAARRLETDYIQVRRWARKLVKAGRSNRKLAAAHGVELP